ncbi:MAG: GAF domain-containing protein, partial [Planctomycetia bacterium]
MKTKKTFARPAPPLRSAVFARPASRPAKGAEAEFDASAKGAGSNATPPPRQLAMTSTSTLPFSLANPSTEPAFAPLEDARRATLDLRLGAVLRGAAKGLAFEAAELWLLDDATKRLRRRAAWQDGDRDVAGAPQRVLVDAEADLAALAGGAVVLEDRATTRRWRLHRSAGAAVGVPVSSDLTIHGVLWLLCDSAREFGDGEVELIEVVAGRL